MESTEKGSIGNRSLFSRLTGNLSIRGKLILAFMLMIALTLVVSAITLVSQKFAQNTTDDLVHIHGKVARLSLETASSLSVMQNLEKDFLLKYNELGIQQAKAQFMLPFTEYGGKAYNALYQIQQLVADQNDVDAAQSAIESINEYLTAFNGTVDILELRVDKEFGELTKLRGSLKVMEAAVIPHVSITLKNGFYQLKSSMQEYLILPNQESVELVTLKTDTFEDTIAGLNLNDADRALLSEQTQEFRKWFIEVTNTDSVIASRIKAYEAAIAKTEVVIDDFLSAAVNKEATATLQMEETSQLIMKIVTGVGIAAILIGILIAILISRGLTTQVNHIVDLLGEIGMGNFNARTEVVSNDELGTMATTLNSMLDNITTLIQSQEERDAIQGSIMKLLEEISLLTEGDLTARAEVTEDMTGAIADSFNAMSEQFSDIIQKVKEATASVDDTSEDVSRLTLSLANKNIQQAEKVTEAIQSIDTMVASIKNVSSNALQSAQVSETSLINAREGAEAVQKTTAAMTEIREQINETARSIKRLGESSMEIGNVVQIIDEIADRTSILALNASIQAAMAGDAGHGFAVVADEVQRLAESSSTSTKQIEALVKNIQTEVKNVSTRMDQSISTVATGSQLADGAHAKLQEIEEISTQLADLVEAITSATTDQVKVSETISTTMQQIGEVSKESSDSSQETATSMDLLNTTARELRSAVEIFKVSEANQAV